MHFGLAVAVSCSRRPKITFTVSLLVRRKEDLQRMCSIFVLTHNLMRRDLRSEKAKHSINLVNCDATICQYYQPASVYCARHGVGSINSYCSTSLTPSESVLEFSFTPAQIQRKTESMPTEWTISISDNFCIWLFARFRDSVKCFFFSLDFEYKFSLSLHCLRIFHQHTFRISSRRFSDSQIHELRLFLSLPLVLRLWSIRSDK